MTGANEGLARSVQVRLAAHARAIGVEPNLVLSRLRGRRTVRRDRPKDPTVVVLRLLRG